MVKNPHGKMSGVPQGSLLLFLIYINDLCDNLSFKAKLFTHDTPLFNATYDINTSENELNNNLKKVSNWAS